MSESVRSLPEDRLLQPTTAKWFGVIFGIALCYAIVRYHFVKDVPWSHFPLFILNKATSMAAVGFVASAYLIGKLFRWHDHDPVLRLVVVKFCGLAGFSLAAIHALFSLALLRSSYYPAFFGADGQLSFVGELGLAVGVIALWALAMPAITTLPMMPQALGGFRWKRNQRMGYIALSLVVVHLTVFGLKGWLDPASWSGMPPVSLVAVLVALVPLLTKLSRISGKRSKRTQRTTEETPD